MTCKRSDTCIHGTTCMFARSAEYILLGGSCYKTDVKLTNEEFIRTCTIEELENLLRHIANNCYWYGGFKGKDKDGFDNKYCLITKNIKEWLKEKHEVEK